MDDNLLGVTDALYVTALTLLLPGSVIEPRWESWECWLGVAGTRRGVPSLVVGLLPFDKAEAGLAGGPIDSPLLKKLGLLRVFPATGEEGSCDRLSIVLSDKDGRDFLRPEGGASPSSFSSACSVGLS